AVDVSRKPPRDMAGKHCHPFVPIKTFSRSASILCPRLSLEATVPMEQCKAFAICSYDRSSKYRSNTAIRNLGGSADTAARTELATCAREKSSSCEAALPTNSRRKESEIAASDLRRRAVSVQAFTTSRYSQVENSASPRNWPMPIISFRKTCCV